MQLVSVKAVCFQLSLVGSIYFVLSTLKRPEDSGVVFTAFGVLSVLVMGISFKSMVEGIRRENMSLKHLVVIYSDLNHSACKEEKDELTLPMFLLLAGALNKKFKIVKLIILVNDSNTSRARKFLSYAKRLKICFPVSIVSETCQSQVTSCVGDTLNAIRRYAKLPYGPELIVLGDSSYEFVEKLVSRDEACLCRLAGVWTTTNCNFVDEDVHIDANDSNFDLKCSLMQKLPAMPMNFVNPRIPDVIQKYNQEKNKGKGEIIHDAPDLNEAILLSAVAIPSHFHVDQIGRYNRIGFGPKGIADIRMFKNALLTSLLAVLSKCQGR